MIEILLALVVAFESRSGLVSDDLIVGHAACGHASFVLTETPELVEIRAPVSDVSGVSDASDERDESDVGNVRDVRQDRNPRHARFVRIARNARHTRTAETALVHPVIHRVMPPVVHPVRGLLAGDHVWGLACLADGSLWTLAGPRTVARLARDGRVQERLEVPLPRIGLFGAGARLLVQQLPIVPGAPALVAISPRAPLSAVSWPGLLARAASDPRQQIDRNVVNCGMGLATSVPCWFAGEHRIVIADGSTSRTLAPPSRSAPWDFALVTDRYYWLLATTGTTASGVAGGRRAAGTLYRGREGAVQAASLDLTPAARLIVSATARRCVLLTVKGSLVEVVER